MSREEPIELSDSESEPEVDRRAWLAPAIHNVISALGGLEGDTYRLGDEAYGCLKDLKRFLRKDDTDDERTVARIFWQARLLPNDLVPLLLQTAGRGLVDDKCAIACADLVTAMTWPIDLADELKELDETLDKGTDYTQLLQSHLAYKAALLQPGVIQALLGILLPCIAKNKKERKERDGQIVNVILHLFRNLAFIKDRPANMHASSDQAEYSTLQLKLIMSLSQTSVLDLLLTIASNSHTDPFFNQYNTLVLEIIYLLFRGVDPTALAMEQSKRSQNLLSRLLEAEAKVKLANARTAASRHSRFGTTLSVRLNPSKAKDSNEDTESTGPSSSAIVLHKQRALNDESGVILDMKKKKKYQKSKKLDEIARDDNLNIDAKNVLRGFARSLIETCLNAFLSSILKDIKSERPKIMEKDHLRLLFVVKWFLEFFLATRNEALEEQKKDPKKKVAVWSFSVIAEVLERQWIVWILKRMRGAMEDKPKSWTELQAGIECLTQLLLLIDSMMATELEDPELTEAAEILQQQIVYNGEVLDIAVDSLRSYKEGVQSLKYLDSSIRLGYTLLRMLEKWSRSRGGNEMYVRKKVSHRRKKSQVDGDEEGVEQVQNDNDHMINEILFTFEAFELRFAHEEITHTLITYLSRYEEFSSPEQMKRVVNLLHRQAVKAKAEGLFFKVSTLNLFKCILSRQASLPREQPYKDLINLITFILRKFFKAVSEDPLLLVEAFFPKTRGKWKQFSSWEPEQKEAKRDKDDKMPAEVQVKRGYSWSQQLGIAIACLAENGQQNLIDWVKEILIMVIGLRQRIIEETDGTASQSADLVDSDDGESANRAARLKQPSNEALAKIEDYIIPYTNDEQATAASKNPHLKLLFRLIKFYVSEDGGFDDELQWYIPAGILPSDLQSSLNIINQYLEQPIDLEGKKASQMLSKKSKRRRRRQEDSDAEDDAASTDEERVKKKRQKKKKEQQVYKSAQFIEDSDAEYGDDEAFWARERAARERTAALAAEGKIANMRASGTKKRKKKTGSGEAQKRQKASSDDDGAHHSQRSEIHDSGSTSSSESDRDPDVVSTTPATTPAMDDESHVVPPATKTKKLRARPAHRGGTSDESGHDRPAVRDISDESGSEAVHVPIRRKAARMVLSDED